MAVEHPTHDTFWHERDTRVRLGVVDIPVYLGCDWDNAPLHLPCTFGAWKALKHNPNVCMSLLAPGGLTWPWESLHYEALALVRSLVEVSRSIDRKSTRLNS